MEGIREGNLKLALLLCWLLASLTGWLWGSRECLVELGAGITGLVGGSLEEKNLGDPLKMRPKGAVENTEGGMPQSWEEAKGLELVDRREQCRSVCS